MRVKLEHMLTLRAAGTGIFCSTSVRLLLNINTTRLLLYYNITW